MSKCPNCGTTLSCGCQKRALPNGKQGCSKCVNTPSVQRVQNNQYDSPTPVVNSAQLTNTDK